MRINGRLWLVIFILSTLVTLPFAGGATASTQHLAHDMAAADTISTADNIDAHCELMAKMQAQKPAQKSAAESKIVDENNHSCCDQGSDCSISCPADCGHCVSVGHGCMAALTGITLALPLLFEANIESAPPSYTLLLAQSTKPPIIT